MVENKGLKIIREKEKREIVSLNFYFIFIFITKLTNLLKKSD